MKMQPTKKLTILTMNLIAVLSLATSCTKTRQAQLPDDQQPNIFAINEIPTTSEASPYSAKIQGQSASANTTDNLSLKAMDESSTFEISSDDVSVPERLKFMFDNLPVSVRSSNNFKITFSIDKNFVTAYKVIQNVKELSPLEKNLAITTQEVKIQTQQAQASNTSAVAVKTQQQSKLQAANDRENIMAGKKAGSLLIPLFKYKIEAYGILDRTKNDLKESTSVLTLKATDWAHATHFQMTAKTDNRMLVGMNADQMKSINQLYNESKLDNQLTTAQDLENQLNIGLNFLDDKTNVFTRLDDKVMHIYEVTTVNSLNDNQKRLLKNNAGNQEVISCQDQSVANYIKSADKDCVLLLRADLPIAYKKVQLAQTDLATGTTNDIQLKEIPRSESSGLVEILENSAAKQVNISGTLDPDSAVKISDLDGEFFYRRTFESASNMFLGRTGTSGDMTIIRFELEDKRIVVRNQQSLITYTGQGPKDREELMSFPVKYIRMNSTDANGTKLTIPVAEETTKEKAEYAIIDWTANTIPDSNSPLAFYSGGNCFQTTSSLRVTDTDMRLAKDGVLNYSLSGSYTVKPEPGCYVVKDVNSAYWGGTMQWNFNVTERISFLKHKNASTDVQFAKNISGEAQAAFNFGVFTLADKVTTNNTLDNRDGSEKYMPIIHDFRNGRKIKYYIGGLNDPKVTSAERRQLIIDASKQVIDEWNKTLRYAFRGTSLERDGDYVDVVVDEGDNTGHLGDLDRNYIWFQELEAENGLLGVAQPAANPRAGTIESANVIIYSGNTFSQAVRLLKITAQAREYEKSLEQMKQQALEEAQASQQTVSTLAQKSATPDAQVDSDAAEQVAAQIENSTAKLSQAYKSMQLDQKNVRALLKGIKSTTQSMTSGQGKSLSQARSLLMHASKGGRLNYAVTEETFMQKIAEMAVDKKLTSNPNQMELALNNAFLQFGQLDDESKNILQKRSELLASAIQFDQNTKSRAGCYLYSRNDINDEALNLDSDPQKNLMINFKRSIMSTLSHELGHAFGLLHNFRASIDKSNYEFPEDKDHPTGRNYSSIMDYIADIDMKYAGPGPYDAHALRAAYTGYVELDENANQNFSKQVQAIQQDVPVSDAQKSEKAKALQYNLVSIDDIMKLSGDTSLVHYTKDTLNKVGLLKFYEQCDDTGMQSSVLCAQFDSGGSATEIVQNYIHDYNRSYTTRNYVYDKINFGIKEKIQIMQRNIDLFQKIRSFLDEAVMTAFVGSGRTKADSKALINDQAQAAEAGYKFFHELIRTPDAPDMSVTDSSRFIAVPYKYQVMKTNENGEIQLDANNKPVLEDKSDIKILEARSLYDVTMTRQKIDTVGIGYDKAFALAFLLQSSAAQTSDDSQARISQISYMDFEQWFLGASDPADSLTLNTLIDILSRQLTTGFFAPTPDIQIMNAGENVEISRNLLDRAAVSAIIGLSESKWKNFDLFADSFKVNRSTVKVAPKDRFNVLKAGQNRSLSDARVSYAAQNSVAADALIHKAATNEFLIANKKMFYDSLQKMYAADLAYQTPIIQYKKAACAKSSDDCNAALGKKMEDYMKDMPQLAPLKKSADQVAAIFVNQLRTLNTKNNQIFLAKELDTATSGMRFEVQVQNIRVMMQDQIGKINFVLEKLKTVPASTLQATINSYAKQLSAIKQKNLVIDSIPLFALVESFIADSVADVTVQLTNNQLLKGSDVAAVTVNGNKLQDDYDQMIEAIDLLARYTNMIDPESNRQ